MSDEEDSDGGKDMLRSRKDLQKENLIKEFRRGLKKDATDQQKMQTLISQAEVLTKFLINKHHKTRKRTRRDFGEDSDEQQNEPDQQDNLTEQPKILTGGELKIYQLDALNWMKTLYENGINGILADDMGLGKTIQAISLIGYLRQFKKIKGHHLIIAPKITLGNWLNEFRKWLPMARVVKLIATKEEREEILSDEVVPGKFDVVITSYEGVRLGHRQLKRIKWSYLIIDEAHKIKNEDSVLSQTVRSLKTQHKLLLTGTPLQNNLHELWALLNFILPELFHSSGIFDNWFSQDGNQEQAEGRNVEMIQKLHCILRPFMLRRTKGEVEKTLPPKKEIHLMVGLTETQLKLYKSLLHNRSAGGLEDKKFYLNLLMQLRKACNHPYLFPGIEDPDLPAQGEHLIATSGKMIVLDKLLHRLKQDNHKVLLFSQMTILLDILQDYCLLRQFDFCRIDGSTDMDVRDNNIAEFSDPNSTKFIFLLSTRAGGLGINLTAADTVIIYDSDWNPQMDLQAMDRAHRIGQKNMVNVYRLITEHTVEQKIIQRQTIKLKWDSLVIQQGRIASQKNRLLSKQEMKNMLQYGASVIFKTTDNTVSDEDIDALLARGESKTQQMNKTIQEQIKDKQNSLSLRMASISIFDITPQLSKEDMEAMDQQLAHQINNQPRSRRQKKAIFETRKPQKKRKILAPDYHLYQDRERLENILQKQQDEELTQQQKKEKEALLATGFSSWSKNDFNLYVQGCQKFGKYSYKEISEHVGKTQQELQRYSNAFWGGLDKLVDKDRILKQIMSGQDKLRSRHMHQHLLDWKVSKTPYVDFNPHIYTKFRSKLYSMEADRFLIKNLQKEGVTAMSKVAEQLDRHSPFAFDHYLRSRTESQLNKRIQSLYKLIQKEKEYLEANPKPKQLARQKKKKKQIVKEGEIIEILSDDDGPVQQD